MIVYTVGTFDLLHVGHLALLNHCKSLGDILAVGVASDAVVNLYKRNIPVVPLEQRVEMLEEDWGNNAHNLDVDAYLKKTGKEIAQVRYNPRTSSTKIKQIVWAQFQAHKH